LLAEPLGQLEEMGDVSRRVPELGVGERALTPVAQPIAFGQVDAEDSVGQ
jgi:hypothetical protein